jgi:hypothetical protein
MMVGKCHMVLANGTIISAHTPSQTLVVSVAGNNGQLLPPRIAPPLRHIYGRSNEILYE